MPLMLGNGRAAEHRNGCRWTGSNYTLPFRKDWYMLFYNKDLFDKAGVAYPSADMTWDEYEELAKQMTSGEGSSKVYGTHNHTWQALVSNWAVQDGKNTLMSEDYSFMKPAYEQAVRMQDERGLQYEAYEQRTDEMKALCSLMRT